MLSCCLVVVSPELVVFVHDVWLVDIIWREVGPGPGDYWWIPAFS